MTLTADLPAIARGSVDSILGPAPTNRTLNAIIDDARTAMDAEMTSIVRPRCEAYLNWYSPPFDERLGRHDAWEDEIDWNADLGRTRSNFPIVRAVVDIWTSLEASQPPTIRAEPERVPPPPPVLDQAEAAVNREILAIMKTLSERTAEVRAALIAKWMRLDHFKLKHHRAVRRKNLYGFSWMKVIPDQIEGRPRTHVMRNPTTVYPLWSRRDPDDLEAVLSVQQESAVRAAAKWPELGLRFVQDNRGNPTGRVYFDQGMDTGNYREVNDRQFDASRQFVWVEDFWWTEREFDATGRLTKTVVHNAVRVCERIVTYRAFPWKRVPFVYWENTDERDSFGWSDVAGVIDINDEFNRRLSEEADVLGMFASPRFQLLGSAGNEDVEMPGPFELIALTESERIEQILARIDVYPAQVHIQALTDLLHRVSGLPPIVWGLIQNAQTSGRSLTASWKATETRLLPKIMRNEQSLDLWLNIVLDYAREYDWEGGKRAFSDRRGKPFNDFRWKFPPMEPRDFQEVTMDAITRRDAKLTTTVEAMRDTGVEDPAAMLEGVKAEIQDPYTHPDAAQAFALWQRAQLDNMAYAQQLGQQFNGPITPAGVNQAVGQARQAQAGAPAAAPPGAEGALPPTAPGAAGNAGQPGAGPGGIGTSPGSPGQPPGGMLTSGTLVRGGDVSNQMLQTQRF